MAYFSATTIRVAELTDLKRAFDDDLINEQACVSSRRLKLLQRDMERRAKDAARADQPLKEHECEAVVERVVQLCKPKVLAIQRAKTSKQQRVALLTSPEMGGLSGRGSRKG